MTVQPILKMGNPILRRVADPIEDPTSSEIRALVADMRESLDSVGGVGLAAPQIGVPLALVIFEVPVERAQAADGEDAQAVAPTVLINPVIEPLSDETALDWEGCLSVPGLRGVVPRHTHIRYSGLDLDGNKVSVEADGFHARVVQHECDHLHGILYPQRMTDMRYLVYEEEMEAFMDSLRKPAENSARNEPDEESAS
ncbi:peptide deformylase [Sneathiella marina]|uniref:Peptide deformylase n=1 Tax=Sneathiella marina TaxID=2950108 RepID=A0ABY4W7V5_9PROT|nr:peptide deformylase [Sneathiella marina]USG62879.1 peptide deformylase [Sneathiella marina]